MKACGLPTPVDGGTGLPSLLSAAYSGAVSAGTLYSALVAAASEELIAEKAASGTAVVWG